ncbi:MAG TPA: 50S ribosomal protein L5 [Candidatus Polarisedimenticolaceae bacterium]|nr:50S ribosomal protein L5 [Candidatus Polarisedimenticolaceae bacterium]
MADKKKDDTKKAAPKKAAQQQAPKEAKAKAKGSEKTKGPDGPKTEGRPHAPKKKPRLATYYQEKVHPALMTHFKYTSAMQAPRFEKIVINMGVGDALLDQKQLEIAAAELGQITGQKPSIRRAKKSIANFKLREGVPIGCMVTLRGARMYEFYDRLINVAVPRIRDFRGLNPRSFDGRGNYTVGLTEQIIFPEINYDKVGKIRGMDVTIVTSARNDEEGRELLKLMNLPFRQQR